MVQAVDVIAESWRRSEAAGLQRAAAPKFRQVTDLAERLARSAELVDIARPRLYRLLKDLPGTSNVVYVADADGIVLYSFGDPSELARFGLTPGYDWSERVMGTNGVGTALATKAPVAVVAAQHFLSAFAGSTCTGAPIFSPDGRLVGAVDVSSSVADARPGRLDQVIALARDIERELALRRKAS